MSEQPKKNEYFNGNKGKLWVNGIAIATATKSKAIRKIKYEDIPSPTGDGTTRIKVGETIEFSGSFKLTGGENFDGFNETEDISIVLANENIAGTITKRIKLDGVTFDEEVLIDFEKGKVTEIELSGQAESMEWLQKK